MSADYHRELLRLLAKTEQLFAEWEAVLVDPASDEDLLLASKLWTGLKQMLRDVERKLIKINRH